MPGGGPGRGAKLTGAAGPDAEQAEWGSGGQVGPGVPTSTGRVSRTGPSGRLKEDTSVKPHSESCCLGFIVLEEEILFWLQALDKGSWAQQGPRGLGGGPEAQQVRTRAGGPLPGPSGCQALSQLCPQVLLQLGGLCFGRSALHHRRPSVHLLAVLLQPCRPAHRLTLPECAPPCPTGWPSAHHPPRVPHGAIWAQAPVET